VEAQFAPEAGQGLGLRVFLDGAAVFEQGMATPTAAWFHLCRDLGYDPERHWDLDPALILFRQVLPALAGGWQEHPLAEGWLPEGVVCLATVQEAWAQGVAALAARAGPGAELEAASCLRNLPLRAVVFHDDPRPREDYVGTGLDEPLVGVFLHLGRDPAAGVTVSKATLNGTGGLRWSPWEPGGQWLEQGREFKATLGPEAFRTAAGLGPEADPGFGEAFLAALAQLTKGVDPVAEACRHAYPASIPWHRDPYTRLVNHTIADVHLEGDHAVLVLDDGTELAVSGARAGSGVFISGSAHPEPRPPAPAARSH
jgi:hypothetical protein